MSGKCCFKGSLHEGIPVGVYEEVCGLPSYVTGSATLDRTIVIISDVFGYKLVNTRLIADNLANAGYRVYIPDILFGDIIEKMDGSVNVQEWAHKHRAEVTRPIVDNFMKSFKEKINPKFLGIIGYCFGAKYALHQIESKNPIANVAAIAHPSFVEQQEFQAICKPLLISAAQNDEYFDMKIRHETEKTLSDINAVFQIDLFSNVGHGFAVRGDARDPFTAFAMNKVLLDQVEWFNHFSKNA